MKIIDLHKDVWSDLQTRRANLPHALLFSGQRGIGKFALAEDFAHSLLCEAPLENHEACGSCAACHWLLKGNHPDFRVLQPEALVEIEKTDDEPKKGKKTESAEEAKDAKKLSQQIKIEAVRALDDFLHVGTHRQGFRVILIHPAEAMNRATANALLKSLEEPISATVFILVSDELARLLPTIKSRCQIVSVPIPRQTIAAQFLAENNIKEAEKLLGLAGGAPFLAMQLAEESALIDALCHEWKKGKNININAATLAIDKLVKADKRHNLLKNTVNWLQKWLFDLLLCKKGQGARYFVTEEIALQKLAQNMEVDKALVFAKTALEYRRICEQPLNSRLFLEGIWMRYQNLFG